MQPGEQRFDDALGPEKIATSDQREPRWLVGELLVRTGEINVRDFKEFRVRVAVGFIVATNRQQARHERLPQCAFTSTTGMFDTNRRLVPPAQWLASSSATRLNVTAYRNRDPSAPPGSVLRRAL